ANGAQRPAALLRAQRCVRDDGAAGRVVNGAGAEPTHIYDPKHSLFFAWKEIVRHWIILNRISRQNRKNGHRYLSLREGIQMFRENKALSEKLAAMTE
ncbi:MAG: hypothetical protein J7578_06460, partial [Chitinophagaceae bacterium]|nr:hypothetical protein [Chitinophagaceae bacterium]